MFIAFVIRAWMQRKGLRWKLVANLLLPSVNKALKENIYYDEIALSLSELQRQIPNFVRSLPPEHVAALRLNPTPATPILNGD